MYCVNNRTMFRAVNYKHGWNTDWFPTQRELVEHLLRMYKWDWKPIEVLDRIKFCNTPEVETHEVETWLDHFVTKERFIAIYDNWGQIYIPATMKNVYLDGHFRCYDFIDLGIYDLNRPPYVRQYRGFRSEPVPHTGTKRHRYRGYRSIQYKKVLLEKADDQCKEYGLRGFRGKRLLEDKYEWPERCSSRNWKDCTKRGRQWQREPMEETPKRKKIPYVDDIWEEWIECSG